MRDLKRSLKKSNNSSPGPDQIHYEILRHLPIETLHILLDIINETWKSDTFPESWREALIISIPKPGKDHFNPLNYRPIALTSCICKTVERMVNERLVWYLEKNGLLAKQQCGYHANRSTIDHLIRLETFIRDAFITPQPKLGSRGIVVIRRAGGRAGVTTAPLPLSRAQFLSDHGQTW